MISDTVYRKMVQRAVGDIFGEDRYFNLVYEVLSVSKLRDCCRLEGIDAQETINEACFRIRKNFGRYNTLRGIKHDHLPYGHEKIFAYIVHRSAMSTIGIKNTDENLHSIER